MEAVVGGKVPPHLLQLMAVEVDQPPAGDALAVKAALRALPPGGVFKAGGAALVQSVFMHHSLADEVIQLAVNGGGADILPPGEKVPPDLGGGDVLPPAL